MNPLTEDDYVMCDDCPCLNTDNEYGCSCNLGYDTAYRRMVDETYHHLSPNCGLEKLEWTQEGNAMCFVAGKAKKEEIYVKRGDL